MTTSEPTAGASGEEPVASEPADDRFRDQLRSLMTIAAAVGATQQFEDLLELIADEACKTLRAASLSISRLSADGQHLKTLINVGDLGPGEEHHPADETYALTDFPQVVQSLQSGYPYLASIDDPDTDPNSRQLLAALGKESAVAIPIMSDQGLWGELWASTAAGARRFTWEDLSFLFAVTGHVAAAIAQAEKLRRLADYAYTDELTGVSSRRRLDERLELALRAAAADHDGHPVSLVMCDVDRLKAVNDTFGHEAGDRLLVRVARELQAAAAGVPEAVVSRMGGDEFCVLLDGCDSEAARTTAQLAADRLASLQPDAIIISCGVATATAGTMLPGELLRVADAAQYQAKQTRPGSVVVADAAAGQTASAPLRRGLRDGAEPLAGLLDHTVHQLDFAVGSSPADRLGIVAAESARRLRADAWAVAHSEQRAADGAWSMRIALAWCADAEQRAERAGAAEITVSPSSARLHAAVLSAETARLLRPDDPEWPLLPATGWPRAMLLAGARRGTQAWLLGLDLQDPELVTRAAVAAFRLLVLEAVHGAGRNSQAGDPT